MALCTGKRRWRSPDVRRQHERMTSEPFALTPSTQTPEKRVGQGR